jgi:hypothetical protein
VFNPLVKSVDRFNLIFYGPEQDEEDEEEETKAPKSICSKILGASNTHDCYNTIHLTEKLSLVQTKTKIYLVNIKEQIIERELFSATDNKLLGRIYSVIKRGNKVDLAVQFYGTHNSHYSRVQSYIRIKFSIDS